MKNELPHVHNIYRAETELTIGITNCLLFNESDIALAERNKNRYNIG